MSVNVLSPGALAAALASVFLFAGTDIAAAARCPSGEIYRPSRQICVSKDKAVAAGIYRGSSRNSVTSRTQTESKSYNADSAPEPKSRPQALLQTRPQAAPQAMAQIDQRAPRAAARPSEDIALGFAPADVIARDTKPPMLNQRTAVETPAPRTPFGEITVAPKPAEVRVSYVPAPAPSREKTPFGSLVALEAAP